MDKVKKYLKENEEQLSVEDLSENVWMNVHQAVKPKHSVLKNYLVTLFNTKTFFLPGHRLKWAVAIALPVLLIFSCTYRVSKFEPIGNILSFNIADNNYTALREIIMLQSTHDFKPLQYHSRLTPGLLSYISFIYTKEEKINKITTSLNNVPTIGKLKVIPVKAKISESLFSALVHKIFNVHIDARREEKKELKNTMEAQLRTNGVSDVKVQILKDKVHLVPDKITIKDTVHKPAIDTNMINVEPTVKPDTISLKGNLELYPKFIKNLEAIGFKNIPGEMMANLIKNEITTNYIKGFHDLGYTAITLATVLRLKNNRVIPQFIKNLEGIGYKNIPLETMMKLSSADANTKYIKGFQDLGYKDISLETVLLLKSNHIYPVFLNNIQRLGYNNVSPGWLIKLGQRAITSSYIQAFQEYGYKDISLETILQLKDNRVVPDFIKNLDSLGYKNIPVQFIILLAKSDVNTKFLKELHALGYKDISLKMALQLKNYGITPSYIKSFHQLGFNNIPLNTIQLLKNSGVTDQYIIKMKKEGKTDLSLDDYLKIKNKN